MFGSGERGGSTETCPACGDSVDRADAREYDKEGDRWERTGKDFEYLCKPCYSELCHQPRKGLESMLIDCGAGEHDREAFLQNFVATVEGVEGSEPER